MVERGGRHRGALARDVGAHTEDATPLGLVRDRGIDIRSVGGGNHVPGAFEVPVTEIAQFQRDPRVVLLQGFHGRRRGAGDDVDVGTVGDQQGQPALRNGSAADNDDLPARQAQADEVGIFGHPPSLVRAARGLFGGSLRGRLHHEPGDGVRVRRRMGV